MRLSQLSALMGLALSSSAQSVRFLPFGDSITEITCWRALVWDMLAAESLATEVDFVGSMTNNPQGCSSSTGNFDMGHEGHSGWQAVDIAQNYISGWAADAQPDIANFMLGTNDITYGRSVAEIIAAYDTMLEALRAVNPNVKVIVDKLIPLSFNNGPVQALNAEIPAWAERHSTAESPIVVADCSEDNGFTLQMLRDGVHPDAAGDQVIADQIGPLLADFVREVIEEKGA